MIQIIEVNLQLNLLAYILKLYKLLLKYQQRKKFRKTIFFLIHLHSIIFNYIFMIKLLQFLYLFL